MQRFFLDRVGPDRTDRDDVGLMFSDLDAAYLDAYEAALELSVEMLRRRQSPMGGWLEIRDERRRLLMEVPFAEVLRPGAAPAPRVDKGLLRTLRVSAERAEALKVELASALTTAKTSVERARATLNRRQTPWGSEAGEADAKPAEEAAANQSGRNAR